MPAALPLSTSLTHSHARLEATFLRLLEAMAVDAPDVREMWDALDKGLLAHMEAEERYVLPQFAHTDRAESLSLLREHASIREQLFELGIAVDLHALRYERSKEFVELLRRHAAREQELLYRWADEHLEPPTLTAVRDHVHATL